MLGEKKYAEKRREYLSQFKKKYDEMTVAEKIVKKALFDIEFLHNLNPSNYGAIHATLTIEGDLEVGEILPMQEVRRPIIFTKRTYKDFETSSECLIRLAKEYLIKHDIF